MTNKMKLTPVLLVDEIEPCLAFWKSVGLEVTTEVPDNGKLVFVALAGGGIEVMLQTRSSLAKDVPALASSKLNIALYLEVPDLERVKGFLKPEQVIMQEREAPYGAKEIAVQDHEGNIITFAKF